MTRTESKYTTECADCGDQFHTYHGWKDHASDKGHSGYLLIEDGTVVERNT